MRIFSFFTQSRLRNKVLLFFILIACVPVLILGGTTLYLIDLAHRRDISSLELQVLDQKEEEIQKFLAESLGVLELQIESLEVLEVSKQPWQESLVKEILRANPAFLEVTFVGLDGKETAKASLYDSRPQLLYVADLPGFQAAKKGESFRGEVYHTLMGPMMSIAAPVKAEGRIVQVLSAEISLFTLSRSVKATRFGATGYVALFDQHGILIAGPENVYPGFNASQWVRVKNALKGEIVNGLNERDRYESIFGTGAVVGVARKLETSNWIGVTEWPIAEADAVMREVRRQVLFVALASILIVLFGAPLFASRLVSPIRNLQAKAGEIEKGNLETSVDIHTHDELEDLGQAFNNMTKGLKRLRELKEEFVFVAAHELRTPVTVIKGYASMLLEGDAGRLSQMAKEFLLRIEQSNQRLLQLVEDLLEVARSEAGRIAIEVKDIDAQEPIRATLLELAQLAKEKAISLNYESGELPHVLGDGHRIKEIMVNLVGNAIKYTPKNGSVWVFHETKDNEVITHIQDNGFGIPLEAQAKIFQKFYRVQTEEASDIQGTGLGLFIVKQLVEKMNGKIWFVSEQGKGTTFSFSLPLTPNL